MAFHDTLKELGERIRAQRLREGLTTAEIEERLILGPGWVTFIESGDGLGRINLSLLLAMLDTLNLAPSDWLRRVSIKGSASEVRRALFGIPTRTGIDIHFDYTHFDAVYPIPSASLEQLEAVLKTLRDGLAGLAGNVLGGDEDSLTKAVKSGAVERAFWSAMRAWPKMNPTDIWGFVIARAYLDTFNHPASFARGDLAQSWKRTGGWALEKILVSHYGPFLARKGIKLYIPPPTRKSALLDPIRPRVQTRLEADKVDVFLTSERQGREICFGVVHVKNSFAERRTDDVDMSRALVRAGYVSPLWTMDCKSWPSIRPTHRGELGNPLPAKRTAKRIDIEDDLYFSACFSYNRNTIPTPTAPLTNGRIVVCDFSNAEDAFSEFIIEGWRQFSS